MYCVKIIEKLLSVAECIKKVRVGLTGWATVIAKVNFIGSPALDLLEPV